MTKLASTAAAPWRWLKRVLTLGTDRIYSLPVVVLMPHSRCNCRCVMCDIWKANDRKQELSSQDLMSHVEAFDQLGVRTVVLSGGEPLLHSNLWTLCRLLRERNIRITLLSTGLLLDRNADAVARWCDEVIVSLDGGRSVHDRIRGIEGAFDRLTQGVRALRRADPSCRVSGRCVVQRLNFRNLADVIAAAHEIPLDRISFLAADVSSTAFNRPEPWNRTRAAEIALDAAEVDELEWALEQLIACSRREFESGFVAESPAKLRRIVHHFRALHGECASLPRSCNAPWVSTVIEADGTVRPCFFQAPLGNLGEARLDEILNADRAIAFRRQLDIHRDSICRDCVCTLRLAPWQDGGGA